MMKRLPRVDRLSEEGNVLVDKDDFDGALKNLQPSSTCYQHPKQIGKLPFGCTTDTSIS
jgi:hypothetical protein